MVACRLTEGATLRRGLRMQFAQTRDQLRRSGRGWRQPALKAVLEHLADAADVAGDRRAAAAKRFAHHVRKILASRQQQESVACREDALQIRAAMPAVAHDG